MKKGNIKSLVAMLCVTAVGIVPVFADVIGNVSGSNSGSASEPVVSSYELGDVNKDGEVNLEDSNLTLGAALEIIEDKYQDILKDEELFKLADMNEDGNVDLEDAYLNLDKALEIVK